MLSRDTVLPATTARVRETQRDARRVDEKQLHFFVLIEKKKRFVSRRISTRFYVSALLPKGLGRKRASREQLVQ